MYALKKHKKILSYLFFGICTTIINILCYKVSYEGLKIPNVISTCFAWVIAVTFAFVTNKRYVFESKSQEKNIVRKELKYFFSCRLLTGFAEVLFMYVMVDMLKGDAILWKLISNVLVIVLNYFASKIVVFKNS